tara:strand:+ start:787 stop:1416 length:630 start_codon:yes stop_codon:yes gene_type:complete
MSYGYVGDTSTSIKQQVKNAGVLSVSDVLDLEGKGQLGGSLELIEEQTISSDTTIDFTSIQETGYGVHYLTFENMSMTAAGGNQIPYYRLSNDGGSSFESSNYNSTGQFNDAGGTGIKLTQRTTYGHLCGPQQSNYKWNGYAYFYDLGNSSKYSLATFQSVGHYSSNSKQSTSFGGSVYSVAETINAIRLSVDTTTLAGGTAKLYGVKQ